LRFLIDADSYFSACADALERARQQVLIVGWDIHGATRLRRGSRRDGVNDALGPFLCEVLSRQPRLRVYILDWDYSFLFALEREWTPLFGSSGWIEHPRLHFRFDDRHPFGASHHQKIVVVDDAVAFVGGIDLTQRRWDTPAHHADDEARCDPQGQTYGPFHDVQAVVDGNAAGALGELARDRWANATGQTLSPPVEADVAPWPDGLEPDIVSVPVAIARTIPEFGSVPATREVEQLYLDAIAAARRWIYIENQYFTSATIVGALENRLRESNGPEILMVLPRDCSGWLEEQTMGLLRARNLERLRAADAHGRFRACYPVTTGERPINVHAKVLVADDRLARVGSSNLSNRSMGFDTECDVAIEAGGSDAVAHGIASLRDRLLAEHLGVEPDAVRSFLESQGSLASLLDRFGDGKRALRPIESLVNEWDVLVPYESIVDPERPEASERLVQELISEESPESARLPWVRILVALAILVSLPAVWRWTPLSEWVDPPLVAAWAGRVQGHPLAPFLVTGLYVAASLVMVPITGLIVATAIVFDPWHAIVYSILGTVASGLAGFGIGHALARDTVRRLAGARLNRVSKLLGRGGIVAVVALRVLPIAPFSIANIVAGASHIRWRDFTIGTAIGLAPGILAINLFKSQVQSAIREPGLASVAIAGAVVVLIMLGIAWARRTLQGLATDER
jgi:phosphatidylserine/phosphatidylglycerophosphate/cardiolipin synthase-like enzyme/uncharacterized membrane protein YdjX (TVP38/TMEM64 family)